MKDWVHQVANAPVETLAPMDLDADSDPLGHAEAPDGDGVDGLSMQGHPGELPEHRRTVMRWLDEDEHSEDLEMAVKRAAAARKVSEAEIIRESIRVSVGGVRPRPRGALYSSGQPIARHAEELLAGFGER